MTPRAWRRYLAAATALLVLYVALPAGAPRITLFTALSASAVVAVLVGVRLHRPALRAPWVLMAAGLAATLAGDLVFTTLERLGDVDPFPSVADVPYVGSYVLLAVGLRALIRSRVGRRDRAGLVDAAIVTVGLGLLAWVYVIAPVLADAEQPPMDRAVAVTYPVLDVLLLALLARLVVAPGARSPASRLLTAAVAAMLAADAGYSTVTTTAPEVLVGLDLLWLASSVLWGAAALHPSMRRLSEPVPAGSSPLTRLRLAALTAAVLLAPTTLAVQLATGAPLDGWAVVVSSVSLFLLVVTRMQIALRQVVAATRAREHLQGELAHQAAHDALTALPNRARVLELVEAALHRGARAGASVGLLFVDLDRFKAVNDTLGHRAGDQVLRLTAERLSALVRAGDAVGRLGGDEFVVLVEPALSAAALVELADRIAAAVGEPLDVDGHRVRVGASVGVAISQDGGTDGAALLHHADVAAYRAKAAGRGRAELFDDALRRELEERADLEAALRSALVQGELVLHYQPVVELTTGAVQGVEALVRWDRPGHGLVGPDAFIPVAEASHLICDVGRWVLGEACRQLVAWRRESPLTFAGLTVAVNVSGRQLASSTIVADVVAALADTGLPPAALVLEITETVLVDEPTATAHLGALRDLGVSISIDDFGTGYTSIGQLQHLHVDTLKIDRSFIGSSEPGAAELVRLMVSAAHAFGLDVVAEGIEHQEQLTALERLECDSAQGYFLGRPAPAAAVAAVITAWGGASTQPPPGRTGRVPAVRRHGEDLGG